MNQSQVPSSKPTGLNQPPSPIPPTSADSPLAKQVPPELYRAAAKRLVNVPTHELDAAAERFVTSAPAHGIDLDLMWATLSPDTKAKAPEVLQVCLAVIGVGKTAMLFVSGPTANEEPQTALAHRTAIIQAACTALAANARNPVRLAQALPGPEEPWAYRAFTQAGLFKVGDLDYLRLPLRRTRKPQGQIQWPTGVQVRPIRGVSPSDPDRKLLAQALDQSYIDTLDCPELCGLRNTDDVIESHISIGEFDPCLWWLAFDGETPEGCMLLNPSPDQDSVELVYLGLSPALRGRGLGSKILAIGIEASAATGMREMTCAVDQRNTPAMRLYERAGFRRFSTRVAMVKNL